MLTQEIKTLIEQYNRDAELTSAMKKSYTERINLLKIMHDEMRKNILSIVQNSGLAKDNIDEVWKIIKDGDGYEIKNIEELAEKLLNTVEYNISHANITIKNNIDVKGAVWITMPKYIFYLTINSLVFNIIKNTAYNSNICINFKCDKNSISLIFKIDKVISSKKEENDPIFIGRDKIIYYLKEYNGKYVESTKNGITEIKAVFTKDFKNDKGKDVLLSELMSKSLN
jgi:hypothetical protein